jgi:4-amino-4-deoxy-L-arabinose transferase-like glycosyltransferase
MNESVKPYFYQSAPEQQALVKKLEGRQFGWSSGFYMTDKTVGEVTPQFFYLWPTWIGIFYSIFGLRNGLYVTPLFALFAVLSIYFFGKTMFNKNVGLIASSLLTLNFAQIWYARYPTTEVFTQFLIFGGLATFILFMRNMNKYFGVVSALCLGEALLTRIDSILLIIPITAFFAYLWMYRKLKKEHLYFLIPFLLSIVYAIFIAFFISTPYTFMVFYIFDQNMSLLISFLLGLVGAVVLIGRKRGEIVSKLAFLRSQLSRVRAKYDLSLLLILLLVYSYFIRPTGDINSDSYNLVKLSWYMAGFLGLFLATLGSIVLLHKKPFSESYLFLGIIGLYTAFFVQIAYVLPDHPWWVRRFLPIVIPSLIIMMSYLLDKIGAIKATIRKVPVGRVISMVLLLLLLLSFGRVSSLLINHVEYDGAIEDCRQIAGPIDKDGIVIVQKSDYFYIIAVPLKYIHDRQIVHIYNINREAISQIREWTSDGKKVYVLDLSEDLAFELYPHYEFMVLKEVPVKWPNLIVARFGEFPERTRARYKTITFNHTYSIYELNPRSDYNIMSKVDLGSNDFGLVYGFNPPELSGEMSFRWSKDTAKIRFLNPENKMVQKIYLRMGGYRPSTVPPANITLSINGQTIAENLTISSESDCGMYDMQVYEFKVVDDISGPEIVLEIQTNAWTPILYGISRDTRTLGVAVDWVMVEWEQSNMSS